MMNSREVDSDLQSRRLERRTAASPRQPEKASFAETALKLGGKSDEEARRTGAIDKADDQVEALFAAAVSDRRPARSIARCGTADCRSNCSSASTPATPPAVTKVMEDSLAVVRRHRAGRHAADDDQAKITDAVLDELGRPATGACWSTANTAARAPRSPASPRS